MSRAIPAVATRSASSVSDSFAALGGPVVKALDSFGGYLPPHCFRSSFKKMPPCIANFGNEAPGYLRNRARRGVDER
jgi:hypothetical protein